jgi:uncharacterized RDD family membrane protein YckC
MQQLRPAPGMAYASLGWRLVAALIDSVVVGGLFIVVLAVASAAGAFDLNAYRGVSPLEIDVPGWTYITLYGLLFIYYAAFELSRGATPGKMALGMRVTSLDGGEPSTGAVVLRNLVRIPEAIFYYVPAGVSCLVSSRRQRLGDLVAGTVVVRRETAAAYRMAPPPPVMSSAQAPGWPGAAVSSPPPTMEQRLDDSLDALKAAALGVRGAHHNYLNLSEREIARGGGLTAEFSPEYAASWHTLADAVIALQRANSGAADAARHAGVSLQQASERRPDLLHLCRELEPYFAAGSDEAVQEAYLTVARRESPQL